MKNPAPKSPARSDLPAPTLLVLLRHGDAGDALALPDRDALRPLSPKGVKQARRAGKALVRASLAPRDVWTSRLIRAQETARVALDAADLAPRLTPTAALAPEADPDRILQALAQTPPPPPPVPEQDPSRGPTPQGRRVSRRRIEATPVVRWLVGHEPHLSRLAALAIGAPATALKLGKGAIAVLAFDGRGPAVGTGVLVGLLAPDLLKALRRRR